MAKKKSTQTETISRLRAMMFPNHVPVAEPPVHFRKAMKRDLPSEFEEPEPAPV